MTRYPQGVRLEDISCPLGCGSGDEPLLLAKDRLHELPGEFTVVRCRQCGLMRTNPRPSRDTVRFYYPQDYRPHLRSKTPVSTHAISVARSSWKNMIRQFLDMDTRKAPAIKPGSMLEIGCATGDYLQRMAASGWRVTGIEFSAAAAGIARGLGYPVYVGPVEDSPDPTEPYDLIVGWMVLEHFHNPVEVLRKLHRWTREGGKLTISTPDAGSMEFKIFRDAWYALQVPTHLFHYTRRTITNVLKDSGWRVDKIFWQNNPNNLLHSLRYVCSDHKWERPANYLLEIVEGRRLRRFHLLLGTLLGTLRASGRMTVWATRV